jgi:hypothetical protein
MQDTLKIVAWLSTERVIGDKITIHLGRETTMTARTTTKRCRCGQDLLI